MSLCPFVKRIEDGNGQIAIDANSIVMVEESTDDVTCIHVLDWDETIKVQGACIDIVNTVNSRKSIKTT